MFGRLLFRSGGSVVVVVKRVVFLDIDCWRVDLWALVGELSSFYRRFNRLVSNKGEQNKGG